MGAAARFSRSNLGQGYAAEDMHYIIPFDKVVSCIHHKDRKGTMVLSFRMVGDEEDLQQLHGDTAGYFLTEYDKYLDRLWKSYSTERKMV